jgi:hypothetical protein
MRCGWIPDGDKLFRHSVFPYGFTKERFRHGGIIKFYNQEDGSLLGSVTWQRLLPTTQHIHGYGCRLAAKQNQKLVAKGEFAESKRRIYCGAYQFTAESIRLLATLHELNEIASAEVTHHPEDGEIAHTDLKIKFNGVPVNIATTKTAIIDRIWAAGCGPLTHVCNCDADIVDHPNSTLSAPPGGAYIDDRSSYLRPLRIVRLRLCEFFYFVARRRAER